MSKENKEKSELPQKILKKLTQEFIAAVDQMDSEDVKKRILTIEGHLYEIKRAKDEDVKLQQAKELAKDLASVYSSSKNEETAKLEYCLFVLENRGVDISGH